MTDRSAAELWASFPHDPRNPALAPLRASDADRQRISQVVTEAFADGRLDREEYDERAAAVLAARTLGELPPLVADLVPDRPLAPRGSLVATTGQDLQQRAVEKWRGDRREAIAGFLFATVVTWTIWLSLYFTGNGHFPWPAIVTAVTGLNMLRVLTGKQETVAAEVRRLEKKRAKELRARDKKPPPP